MIKSLVSKSLVVALLSGCTMINCVEDNGEVVERSIDVNGFDGVALDLVGDMKIIQGDAFQVQLRGASNILELVEVVVEDGVCHLRSRSCYSTNNGVKAIVTMPNLSRVELNGSGDIEIVQGFTMAELFLVIKGSGDMHGSVQSGTVSTRIDGSGDITLGGATGIFDVDIDGAGDVHAFELRSGKCHVEIDGAGDAEVNVSKELKVEIKGSGDVTYRGEPTIEQNINGSGELRKAKKAA